MPRLALIALMCLAACRGSAAPDDTPAPPQSAWPCLSSDLPLDPRVHLGALDNGMRYAWMPNAEPRGQCSLRLVFDVGSLDERDGERGMAHFVEHMAFNGSRHFAPGELRAWFARHGLTSGADSNALTGYETTSFKLDLKASDPSTLGEALEVFRDFADGIAFDEAEIERERGVIDSEERERDMPSPRVGRQRFELLARGTRYPECSPIGLAEDRRAFTAAKLREFYTRGYRPDTATLLLVGDLGELDPLPLIERAFGAWKPASTSRPVRPSLGVPTFANDAWALYEPGLTSLRLDIYRVRARDRGVPSRASLIEDLRLDAAHELLNRRLSALAAADGSTFSSAGIAATRKAASLSGWCDGEMLQVVCRPGAWREALPRCRRALQDALDKGFDAAEVEPLRSSWLLGLDDEVAKDERLRSDVRIEWLVQAIDGEYVPISAADWRTLMKDATTALNAEQCRSALAEAWESGTLVLGAYGNVDLGEDAGDRLREAWRLELDEIVETEPAAPNPWRYASTAAEGRIVNRWRTDDLDIVHVAFDNHVVVHIKHTDFSKGEVLVEARFGDGTCTSAPEDAPLAILAQSVFVPCGVAKHSLDELVRWSQGRRIGVAFEAAVDLFELHGTTSPHSLRQQCELTCAYLSDPAWGQEGWRRGREQLMARFDQLERDVSGPYQLQFLPAVLGGDARYGLPPRATCEAVELDDVMTWLTPQLADARLDVGIVGDVDVENAVTIAAQTFGMLPRREDGELGGVKPLASPRAGVDLRCTVDSDATRALVALLFPTCDGFDARTRASLNLLGAVVRNRLYDVLREKLGSSYEPTASARASATVPGFGFISSWMWCDPARVDEVCEATRSVGDALANDGASIDELERARQPALARIRAQQRTNSYWLEAALVAAHTRPEFLDDTRNVLAVYAAVTVDDLNTLARRYLTRDNSSRLIVTPRAR